MNTKGKQMKLEKPTINIRMLIETDREESMKVRNDLYLLRCFINNENAVTLKDIEYTDETLNKLINLFNHILSN